MKTLSLILSSLTLIIAAWVFSVWMDPDRICLNSPVVSSLFVQSSEDQLEAIPECHVLSRLIQPRLEPHQMQQLKGVTAKIHRLTSFAGMAPRGWRPIEIVIDYVNPLSVQSEDSQRIFLGAEFARLKGQVEKVVFLKLFEQRQTNNDRMALEIVADFYSAVAINDFSQYDVLTHVDAVGPDPKWIQFLQTFKNYCHSSLKSLFHYDYCTNQNSLFMDGAAKPGREMATLDDVTIWGLRSFVSHSLWRYFQKLELKQKSGFLQELGQNFLDQKFEYPDSLKSLGELSEWSVEYLEQWLQEPLALGFKDEIGLLAPNRLDYIFDQGVSEKDLATEFNHAMTELKTKNSPQLYAATWKGRVKIYPGERKIPVKVTELESDYWILKSCGEHSYSELAKINAEKIVIIDSCTGEASIPWKNILQKGLVRSLQNKNQKFAVLHTNSLRFALEKQVLNKEGKFIFSTPEKMSQTYSWQSLDWDRDWLAYRPMSDINVVTHVRLL